MAATQPATGNGGTGGNVTVTDAGTGAVTIAQAIDTRGGTGQDGGNVSVSGAGNVNFSGAAATINTSGGAASATGAAPGAGLGRSAGTVNISSSGAASTVTLRGITAAGTGAIAASNKAGGSGGTVNVQGNSVVLNAAVSTVGGNANGTGVGGSGGIVGIIGGTGTVSSVAAGTITTTGGTGQGAGNVSIGTQPNGTINLAGAITANGGAGQTGAAGFNGGTVMVNGGAVTLAAINARGGNAAAASAQAGGSGGPVLISTAGAAAPITLNGAVTTIGGNANGIGSGGTGGNVTVTSGGTGAITVAQAIDTRGGTGQNGGTVTVTGTGNVNFSAAAATINTSGGAASAAGAPAGAGLGRNAGGVLIQGSDVTAQALTASGSNAAAGSNKNGGNGGNVALDATDATPVVTLTGNIASNGGNGNGTGIGGSGGLINIQDPALLNANTAVNAIQGTGGVATGGTVTFANTLDSTGGARTLAVNTGNGTATFSGAVGGTAPLASVTTNAGGTAQINGGAVTTTLAQTYGGAVTLGADATLTSTANGNIAFAGTVNSANATARALAVDTGGTTTFGGAVGGTNALSSLTARGAAGMTVNGPITVTGGGSSIVLAGATFTNNAGAGALNPGAGRWLVYSNDPATNTFNGLVSGQQALWGRPYPAPVTEGGNRYAFVMQPTLTFTSTDVAKTYGQDATAIVAGAYAVSGFVNAALYGGVFTQDTAANAVSGAPTVTSLGSPATAAVAGSPYAINVSTAGASSPNGYALAGNSAGLLTVNPAALTVTADDRAKTYGQTVVFAGTEFTSAGLQNGETIGSVTLASAGAPGTASVAGSPYAITASNATGGTFNAANYTITYNNGVLTVSPAALTVTANNQAKAYGQTVVFTGTEFTPTGLQNGETIGSVTLASLGAPATASVAGSPYAITASNATGGTFNAANYTITYNNGVLTVSPAALTVTANNQAKAYGQTVVFTGTEFTPPGCRTARRSAP